LPKHSLLADLVDLQTQLRLDQQADREQLKKRDRQIGIDLKVGTRSNLSAMRGWINALRSGKSTPGVKAQRSITTLIVTLWIAGLVSGWALAQTVLAYDGSEPVNIVSTLIVLVGIQLLTLLLLLVFTSGAFSGIFEALSIFNPAALLTRVIGWIWHDQPEAIKHLLSQEQKLHGVRLRLPLLTYLAQHFTVALNLGIVAALLYLVTISDLAFGWYSTLEITNASMTRVLHTLSAPWNQLLPTAVPGAELVDISRFYRLQSTLRSSSAAAGQLGTWWIFILMCLLVYGLIPRLIALVIYGIRYDRIVTQGILASQGAGQVLARMGSPLVSTLSDQSESEQAVDHDRHVLKTRPLGRALPCIIVEWSGAKVAESALDNIGIEATRFFTAGGHQSLADDHKVTLNIADHKPQGVAVITKSWEPPLLELVDFIEDIRFKAGKHCAIVLLLMPMDQAKVTPEQLQGWETALAPLDDTALYVEPL